MAGLAIKNLTRQHVKVWAGLPFAEVTKEVLPGWELSLVFLGPTKARALNERLRGEQYVPNVLSYALKERSGEVIICLAEAKRQAPAYGMREREFILYLFIHGLLHIKGWAHGARMEQCERKLLARHGATDSRRRRHRHAPGKSGGRRGALR